MIVKLAEGLHGERYKRRSLVVTARRMKEDFIFETQQGWVKGFKGQWLVEIGEGLRCNLDHEAFLRSHKPVEEGDGEE